MFTHRGKPEDKFRYARVKENWTFRKRKARRRAIYAIIQPNLYKQQFGLLRRSADAQQLQPIFYARFAAATEGAREKPRLDANIEDNPRSRRVVSRRVASRRAVRSNNLQIVGVQWKFTTRWRYFIIGFHGRASRCHDAHICTVAVIYVLTYHITHLAYVQRVSARARKTWTQVTYSW